MLPLASAPPDFVRLAPKFWAQVDRPHDLEAQWLDCRCWRWLGKMHRGRALFHVGSTPFLVQRYVYRLYIAELDRDTEAVVTCGEPRCVNPRHLATRPKWTMRGGARRLTLPQIADLQHLRKLGIPWARLCKMYDVSEEEARSICRGAP